MGLLPEFGRGIGNPRVQPWRAPVVLGIILLLAAGTMIRPCVTAAGAMLRPAVAQASTGIPGAYVAWALPSEAMPIPRASPDPLAPGNQVLGVDCLTYLGSDPRRPVANSTLGENGTINWQPFDSCLEQAAGRSVTLPTGEQIPQPVVLTIPGSFMDGGGSGTPDDPYIILHIPQWMRNETYTFRFAVQGHIYQSIRYDGPFKEQMIEFVRQAGARYNAHPQVGLVRVYAGYQGETQPVLPQGGDDQLAVLTAHQETVSCDEYLQFVRELAEATYAAFPDKPVVVMAGVEPCADVSKGELFPGERLRRILLEAWNTGTAQRRIGFSINSLMPDRADADSRPGNQNAGWQKYSVGLKLRQYGAPVAFEFAEHPWGASVAGQDRYQYVYWSVLAGAAMGGQFILTHASWLPYWTEQAWQVNDYWIGSDTRAWLVLRDREWPTYNWTSDYGLSGVIGDFARYLTVLNPGDAVQACSPQLWARAQAANSAVAAYRPTPACLTLLPTPVSTQDILSRLFDRQARQLRPAGQMAIAVDPLWRFYGGSQTITVTLSYLDNSHSAFTVLIPDGPGSVYWQTIPRTNSGVWRSISWTQPGYIANTISTPWGKAFILLSNTGEAPLYLHEIYIDVAEGSGQQPPALSPGSPTATSTPSPSSVTATPRATSTATATSTWTPTPTATWTPTPTVTDPPSGVESVLLTPSPRPTQAATPVPTATPTPNAAPGSQREATVESTPSRVPTASAVASATPVPSALVTPTATPLPVTAATPTPSATAQASRTTATETAAPYALPTPTAIATPAVVRAKIQEVWPEDGQVGGSPTRVRITAYLISETGNDSPPCLWEPVVLLWAALDNEPARVVARGEKRMATAHGRTFPVWDFEHVDVSAARDTPHKLSFFVTVEGVRSLPNIWTYGADVRTIFPQVDVPVEVVTRIPAALDARIEVVWPYGGRPVEEAQLANITAYLFEAGTLRALSADLHTLPKVRLHWSVNNETESRHAVGILGQPRRVRAANGLEFLAWDFEAVNISAAQDPHSRIYFWVSVDDVLTFPTIWIHSAGGPISLPQPEVPNGCR